MQISLYNLGMKRIFNTKVFIAIIFFCIGFLTNHLLVKYKTNTVVVENKEERFPINPSDFDHRSMIESIERMNEEEDGSMMAMGNMGEVTHREDDKFSYYEIPLKNINGANQKMNVEIKDGMIKISEDIKTSGNTSIQSTSERMFSIDPSLDGDRAEVINEKDKIVIKIPKK